MIFLLRDPRGVMNSRSRLSWCAYPSCSDPATACRDLLQDLRTAKASLASHPRRVHLLRYEDLSSDPHRHAAALFSFLGLPLTRPLRGYLDGHTSADVAGRHSTQHDSRSHVFRWRGQISEPLLARTQAACGEAMAEAGYAPIADKDDDGFPLSKSADEIWSYPDFDEQADW